MQSLDEIGDSLLSFSQEAYPPVHSWNPPFSGNIDITIKSNGDWYHEGVKFTRLPLVKLFSSILKKEGDNYFLVTPVEKWKITVEDAPLHIVKMDISKNSIPDQQQVIVFKTITDDIFTLDQLHPLQLFNKKNAELRPYVVARNNLEALVHRNIFYRLADMAVLHEGRIGIWSSGEFFPLE
jgi:uncharacterized protein